MSDPLLDALVAAVEAGESVALVTAIQTGEGYTALQGRRGLVWLDRPPLGPLFSGPLPPSLVDDVRQLLSRRHPQLLTYRDAVGELSVFVEVQRRPPSLLIVGAGHIAVPLAQLGKLIDFAVTVLDDRPRYANQARFPMADAVVVGPFRQALREQTIDQDTFIVLATRGHSHDVECLLEVINSPARYIGMIGSKRRVQGVFDLLQREYGIDPSRFERVYAPIGLDIGAETPAEIAVSIIAEIITIYRGGRAPSLSAVLRANRRLPLHPGRSAGK